MVQHIFKLRKIHEFPYKFYRISFFVHTSIYFFIHCFIQFCPIWRESSLIGTCSMCPNNLYDMNYIKGFLNKLCKFLIMRNVFKTKLIVLVSIHMEILSFFFRWGCLFGSFKIPQQHPCHIHTSLLRKQFLVGKKIKFVSSVCTVLFTCILNVFLLSYLPLISRAFTTSVLTSFFFI